MEACHTVEPSFPYIDTHAHTNNPHTARRRRHDPRHRARHLEPRRRQRRGENVATALKLGYRHIDTAWKYGSERDVGEGIRASGVPRGDIFLCTKVSHEYLRAADFARSVDESLANLGVDYVDLLLVHWPNAEIPLKETMGALAKAKRDGLARHIGVANFNIALLDEAIALCPEPLVNLQGEGHPYHRHDQDRRRLPRARHGVHRLLPARARTAVRRSGAGRDREAQRPHLAQVALRWLIQRGNIVPIPRSSNPGRLAENLDVFSFTLSDDEMARIGALKRANGRIANPAGRAPKWD